jgi:serine protease Do
MSSLSPKPRSAARRALFGGLAALALGTTALTALNLPLHAQSAPAAAAVAAPRAGAIIDYSDLAEKVGPAVVSVKVVTGGAEREGPQGMDPEDLPPALRRFFEQMPRGQQQPQQRRMGQGSGFIIDADGTIVTNNHVAGGASEVRVTLADGREFPARVLGTDPRTDLAVLKIDAPQPLPFVTFAQASAIRVGAPVMAMGNPFGLGGTVTAGIISARGRDIGAGPADEFIQHDAAINPGNSGGPLFDMAGNVVGVNTAILSPSGGSVGIGFAIPSPVVQKVVAELREHGTVNRGYFGVVLAPLDPTMAAALGREDGKGAVVREVAANSPAARAGLRTGDVIVKIDGRAVESPRDVVRVANTSARGEKVTVTVLRRDGTSDVAVTLGAMPQERAAQSGQSQTGQSQTGQGNEEGPRKDRPGRG